jgi:hypothetical protein
VCCGLASRGDAEGVDVWRVEAGNGGVRPGRLLLGRVSCWHGAACVDTDVCVEWPPRGCTGGQRQGRSDAGEEAAGSSQAPSAPTADGAARSCDAARIEGSVRKMKFPSLSPTQSTTAHHSSDSLPLHLIPLYIHWTWPSFDGAGCSYGYGGVGMSQLALHPHPKDPSWKASSLVRLSLSLSLSLNFTGCCTQLQRE